MAANRNLFFVAIGAVGTELMEGATSRWSTTRIFLLSLWLGSSEQLQPS